MTVIPLREVRVLDRNAEALGVDVETLMENAGRAVADAVAERLEEGASVVILAGPGNNGGDGLVAARHLAMRGVRVSVVTPASGRDAFRSGAARRAFDALPDGVAVATGVTEEADVLARTQGALVVDALLGAGLAGAPREPYASYVRAVNAGQSRVVSVDVPTGLGSELAVRADETITLHALKEGMDELNSGRITVADIGIPERAATHTGPGEFELYPRPRPDQHKGVGGVVLIVGGGPYTGAPALAGLASLRTGADLAIILTPRPAWPIIAGYSPNLIVRPLNNDMMDFNDPANRVALNQWLKKADVLLVGPGLGLSDLAFRAAQHAVERALSEGVPVVADAEALQALAEKPDLVRRGVVVTAHAREFEVLTGERVPVDVEERSRIADAVAKKRGATFLLKGPVDVIADGERVKLNATGHPSMSVGGTGDALAGIVACLVAKGLTPFDAARLGAYVCGRAGEEAVGRLSHGVMATDVVEGIPGVLGRHLG